MDDLVGYAQLAAEGCAHPLVVFDGPGSPKWANTRALEGACGAGPRWFQRLPLHAGDRSAWPDGCVYEARPSTVDGGTLVVAFISVPFDARDLAAAGELERDQRRLAQALHDEAIQRVAAALLLLDIEGLGVDSLARGELEAAIVAGRRLLDDIRPPLLDELGVHQALFSVFEREWPDRDVELDYRGPEGTRWLGRGGGTLLWKALSACVRSAMSDPSVRRVRVSLELLDRLVRGSVRDDGGSRIGLVSADGSGAPGLDGAKVALEAVGGGLHVRTWDEWTEVVFHLHLGDVP